MRAECPESVPNSPPGHARAGCQEGFARFPPHALLRCFWTQKSPARVNRVRVLWMFWDSLEPLQSGKKGEERTHLRPVKPLEVRCRLCLACSDSCRVSESDSGARLAPDPLTGLLPSPFDRRRPVDGGSDGVLYPAPPSLAAVSFGPADQRVHLRWAFEPVPVYSKCQVSSGDLRVSCDLVATHAPCALYRTWGVPGRSEVSR